MTVEVFHPGGGRTTGVDGGRCVSTSDELTFDELAALAGMTVRNVRAYAGPTPYLGI